MSIGLRVFLLTVFVALGFALPHAADVQAAEKRVTQKSKAKPVASKVTKGKTAKKQVLAKGAVKSKGVISPGASFGALQFEDGRIFCGRYAENAAFNPSLPPMQMACAHAVLNGEELTTVRRAVLLESKSGQISQRDSAQSTLKALGRVELEYQAV